MNRLSTGCARHRSRRMRFTFTPEQEAFRAEVNAFLKETLPADWEGADNAIDDEQYEFGREFLKKLAPKRWIAPAWPKEYGGLALSHWDQVIFNEAMGYARAPIVNTAAVGYLGPTIILYGTRRAEGSSTCRASRRATSSGARATASRTPAPTSRRCRRAPCRTATTSSSTGRRSGRARRTTPTGCSCSRAPTRTRRSIAASATS